MKELLVFFSAMLPGTELRLSIPLAFALGMSPAEAFCYSFAGNMVPVLLLPVILEKATDWLRKFRVFDKLIGWLFARIERHSGVIAKYGVVGLVLFVAVPMPGTGGWAGSVAAFLMRMRYRTTVIAVSAGMAIAGVVVTLACMGVIEIARVVV